MAPAMVTVGGGVRWGGYCGWGRDEGQRVRRESGD